MTESTSRYRLRWRDDASGVVARFAGQWAQRDSFATLAEAAEIRNAMMNGGQLDIAEIPSGAA